ncbi:GNAT family N-acetyltransferase [Jannaschia sp. R86511]|uniref:GNAT family N-acetyltransferase n=1 Tax=Jannaschia sp. R86511 TaxID=3093853 RepID=UPI0036D4279F
MASQPRTLKSSDSTAEFESGAQELDDWLKRFAYTNLRANNAITYVTLENDRVVGYYAIAMAAAELKSVPGRLQKGGRPEQLPCLLLARLAVDKSMQGHGLGVDILQDALRRAAMLSDSVAAAAVLVHARDETARRFYEHNVDVLPSPLDELQLFIPMKDVRKHFGSGS